MSMPFYVSPEQITKDKADFARKGIARGKSIVVAQCDEGILFVAENHSRALHKISEIYDRIAFGAVGKYNEFEQLRVAGIRLADTRGFAYDRSDVSGRSLANAYAQTLGAIFTDAPKPYEVELVVAEVGADRTQDQIYRLAFDGSVADEAGFVAMGGAADALTTSLREQWRDDMDLAAAVRMAVSALGDHGAEAARTLTSDQLEVAVLDRKRPRRRFRRIEASELDALLAG
jgi:proteasome alpha subunit